MYFFHLETAFSTLGRNYKPVFVDSLVFLYLLDSTTPCMTRSIVYIFMVRL